MRKLLLIMGLLLPLSLYAQKWNYGVDAGASFNNLVILGGNADYVKKSQAGFKGGAFASYTSKIGLQYDTGLYYFGNRGGSLSDFANGQYDYMNKISVDYDFIQLPVNIGYKFQITDKFAIIPKVGMWAAVGVSGDTWILQKDGSSANVFIDPFKDNQYTAFQSDHYETHYISTFSRWDFGASVGLELQYWNFTLKASCDFGLQDMNFELGSPYTRSYSITLGYKF